MAERISVGKLLDYSEEFPHPRIRGAQRAPDCPSCALAALPKDVPNSQPEMVEAVKKHILNMLHLKKRPDVTQPVPKAALLNAIRKLHVGKVGENGYVEIEDDIGRRAEMNELMEQTSEIITFAESGTTRKTLHFEISKEGSDLSVVERAEVWLFLKVPKANRTRTKVTIRLFQQQKHPQGSLDTGEEAEEVGLKGERSELLLSEKVVDARKSTWHVFPVSSSIQRLLDQEKAPWTFGLPVSSARRVAPAWCSWARRRRKKRRGMGKRRVEVKVGQEQMRRRSSRTDLSSCCRPGSLKTTLIAGVGGAWSVMARSTSAVRNSSLLVSRTSAGMTGSLLPLAIMPTTARVSARAI